MPDGVVHAVNSGKQSEFEWKIENYTLNKQGYLSPYFKFEGETWYLSLFPNGNARYSSLCLGRSSGTSPIEVEFCISIKTARGEKSFERPEKNCFDGWGSYTINQWIPTREFRDQQREFLRSGCLTIIFTMKKEDSGISESASAAADSSWYKDSHRGDKISLDRKFFDKFVKCSQCDELLSLKNWAEHVCQISNAKAARSEAICFSCKENLHDDKIAFHKECLNKEAICPRCNEVVMLQNWFDHVCQMENVPAAANTSEAPMVTEHGKILEDLKHLFLNQEHSDVVLRVSGKKIPAHKAILSARSPVFASTFRHEMKENKTGIVNIEDCDPSIFPDFLRFLYYNDTSNLSVENVFGLFTIADKYDCEELRVKCVWFIINNLTVETFCKVLALALLHSEAELLRVTTDFFIENAAKILVTVDWQTFAAENPIESNELFIKYVNSISRSNK